MSLLPRRGSKCILRSQRLVDGFFFSSRRRHTSWNCDWSSDVCSSDLIAPMTSALSIAREASPLVQKLRAAVEHALEGKPEVVELSLVTLLARGHLLIEDVPRSEERRVGKECRSRRWYYDVIKSE